MSQTIRKGPCGYWPHDIVAMADRIGRHIADFGITDPDDVTSFLTGLGTKLTSEFIRLDVERELPLYEERLAQVALTVVTTFRSTDCWQACSGLGPYDGPALEEARCLEGGQMVLDSFDNMRRILKVSASEILDLLVWVQCALSIRNFLELCPECE